MRFSKPLISVAAAAVTLGAFALSSVQAEAAIKPAAAVSALPAAKSGKAAPGGGTAKTLVLYDTTGAYGWMGEVYATQTANLSSHFGSWTAAPVGSYKAGDLNAYTAVIYVGSTYDEPLPAAFLTDVTATAKPVTWLYDNIWQLTASGNFAAEHGFTSGTFDLADVAEVSYKGQTLTRDTVNKSGIMNLSISDPAKVTTLATAKRPDGTTFPWAVRSGNFTYVGEIPFAYVTHDDRYLAFADLLFDSLGFTNVDRHRGLVRIEDVGPDSDPAELKAVADYLSSEKVPFTVAVYPRYRDPKGVNNGGKAQDYTLLSKPKVVAALKYMQGKGGTLLMHGYTHQYGTIANPYDGVSANDFEFYAAHVDANDSVIYDGPVPGDSAAWATSRMVASGLVFTAAGLGTPTIFEFPHYAASAVDYQVANTLFGKRYDRGLYFPGVLTGAKFDYSRQFGQFFPYAVRDVYGSAIVPENIGNVEPDAFNNHPARLPSDLLGAAKRNLVVRDGVASFFYHPYLGTDYLKQVVTGIKAQGYTFVSANSMLTN
ncbi:polysaccharide deacetylase family protein [Actinoplanes sp. TRM 88003]|uniref:Polysaccharide deacetylase family protein n=1 Tax=Paractinoplanes aksuensis TaxID=2939490 RepID=A0ABT1DDY4_9ACTN|nr:polysaccharide deacetylase family protein [Actinoplanes aksuensis]MCO8269022.1 polysaccharide deacetylase family protein [Actinoplanes aksuensis]